MAEPAFLELRRQLIQGGISPRRVGRLLRELRDHHAELVLESQRAGSPHPVEDALARLGTEEMLARQFLARPELLSWSRRWPWAVYAFAPLLLFPAAFVATICVMDAIGHLLYGSGRSASPLLLEVLRTIRFFGLYLLPVAVASGLALLAKRRGVSTAWGWVSIAILAFLGGLTNIEVGAHHIGAGVGFATRPTFLAGLFLHRWLPCAVCAAALYALALIAARQNHASSD